MRDDMEENVESMREEIETIRDQIKTMQQELKDDIYGVTDDAGEVKYTIHTIDGELDGVKQQVGETARQLHVLLARRPVLLTNSNAGIHERLLDPRGPTAWQILAAPNPTSREDLANFTRMFHHLPIFPS